MNIELYILIEAFFLLSISLFSLISTIKFLVNKKFPSGKRYLISGLFVIVLIFLDKHLFGSSFISSRYFNLLKILFSLLFLESIIQTHYLFEYSNYGLIRSFFIGFLDITKWFLVLNFVTTFFPYLIDKHEYWTRLNVNSFRLGYYFYLNLIYFPLCVFVIWLYTKGKSSTHWKKYLNWLMGTYLLTVSIHIVLKLIYTDYYESTSLFILQCFLITNALVPILYEIAINENILFISARDYIKNIKCYSYANIFLLPCCFFFTPGLGFQMDSYVAKPFHVVLAFSFGIALLIFIENKHSVQKHGLIRKIDIDRALGSLDFNVPLFAIANTGLKKWWIVGDFVEIALLRSFGLFEKKLKEITVAYYKEHDVEESFAEELEGIINECRFELDQRVCCKLLNLKGKYPDLSNEEALEQLIKDDFCIPVTLDEQGQIQLHKVVKFIQFPLSIEHVKNQGLKGVFGSVEVNEIGAEAKSSDKCKSNSSPENWYDTQKDGLQVKIGTDQFEFWDKSWINIEKSVVVYLTDTPQKLLTAVLVNRLINPTQQCLKYSCLFPIVNSERGIQSQKSKLLDEIEKKCRNNLGVHDVREFRDYLLHVVPKRGVGTNIPVENIVITDAACLYIKENDNFKKIFGSVINRTF